MMVCWVVQLLPARYGLVCWFRGIQGVRSKSSQPLQGSEDDVVSEVINNKGLITLNRPKALNSLNYSMVTKMIKKLSEWENEMECVIVKGSGDKAFSAGGDVVAATSGSPTNCKHGKDFFRKAYKLYYLVKQCKTSYIAFIDGITMGGGAGISVHGKYRIATEKTLFAMPENAIGFFPDVGASYFLPKLEGKLGLYLGLTGQRLRGKDVVKIGLGTHFVESKDIPKLLDAILKVENGDFSTVLKQHAQDLSSHNFSFAANMATINEAFSAPTVEEIIKRLEKDGSEFSLATLKLLNSMSPISLKITKVELEKGVGKSLEECLQMEYRLAKHALEATSSPDFYEGVRALLKDKDRNPKWKPARLEDVAESMINRAFEPISPDEELKL